MPSECPKAANGAKMNVIRQPLHMHASCVYVHQYWATAYYTNEFSFGHFLKEHPQYSGNLTDLLIGRIFHDGAGRIFDDMDPAMHKAKELAEAPKAAATAE